MTLFLRRRHGAPELSSESYKLPCAREPTITSGSSSRTYKVLLRSAVAANPMPPNFVLPTSINDGDAENVFNRNRQESQMYSSLTAVVLCIFMQAAAAQCV